MLKGKYVCPNCGSENILSVPQQYERGHSTEVITKREVVDHRDQIEKTTYYNKNGDKIRTKKKVVGSTPIYGNVKTTYEQSTKFADRLAPPEEPKKPTAPSPHDTRYGCYGCLMLILFIAFAITIPVPRDSFIGQWGWGQARFS